MKAIALQKQAEAQFWQAMGVIAFSVNAKIF
jgi:hypothetical protein